MIAVSSELSCRSAVFPAGTEQQPIYSIITAFSAQQQIRLTSDRSTLRVLCSATVAQLQQALHQHASAGFPLDGHIADCARLSVCPEPILT